MGFLHTLKTFAFWGLAFLLILIFGYNASIIDIAKEAVSFKMILSAYCIFMLASIVLFPVLFVVSIKSATNDDLMTVGDAISVDFFSMLRMPYCGFDIRGIRDDILFTLIRFFETALWWFCLIFGIYTIYHQRNNLILQAIQQKSILQRLIILGICLIIYFIVKAFSWLGYKRFNKKIRGYIGGMK